MDSTKGKSTAREDNEMTLSAAILAPLNALFETQVHAARAFLSFILQMGYRHQYTDEDLKTLGEEAKTDPGKKRLLDEINTYKANKKRFKELLKKKSEGSITDEELTSIKHLAPQVSDLYTQSFQYFDNEGNEMNIVTPNLALIPVKPLAIKEAEYNFELQVSEKYEDYQQQRASTGASTNRPWFFIKPRRIKGKIAPKSSENSTSYSAMKIEIKVGEAELPQGLKSLLVSLTENSKIVRNQNSEED